MKIGLISDTHGLLRPEVFDHFQGVAHIVHAGDIGPYELVVELETIAPVVAVFGNTDGFDVRQRLPAMAQLEVDGRRIVVTHGHELGAPTPARLVGAYRHADIIVYGHTHRALVEHVGRTLVINPGGAGAPRFSLRPSIALLTLGAGIEDVELITL